MLLIVTKQYEEQGLTSTFCTASRNTSVTTHPLVVAPFIPSKRLRLCKNLECKTKMATATCIFLLLSNRHERQAYTIHRLPNGYRHWLGPSHAIFNEISHLLMEYCERRAFPPRKFPRRNPLWEEDTSQNNTTKSRSLITFTCNDSSWDSIYKDSSVYIHCIDKTGTLKKLDISVHF
jgi:hypothetical protein